MVEKADNRASEPTPRWDESVLARQDLEGDRDLIAARLTWTPRERLQDLLDMLAFEEKAHRARRLPRKV